MSLELAVAIAAAVAAAIALGTCAWLWVRVKRLRVAQRVLLGGGRSDLVEFAVSLQGRIDDLHRAVDEIAAGLSRVDRNRGHGHSGPGLRAPLREGARAGQGADRALSRRARGSGTRNGPLTSLAGPRQKRQRLGTAF